jgi:mRNA interferase YafQ
MRLPKYTKRFRRDYAKMKHSGKKIGKLDLVLEMLTDGKELPAKYGDHLLKGEWEGVHDCHVEGDWILLYELGRENGQETIMFHATDNHENLFG